MAAIFQSVYHPGAVPLALVLARAQAQPVALALVGVFVVTFVAVLRGEAVLGTLLWAVPVAYVLAVGWAVYELHRRPAEIVLRGGFGAIRSVWDVAAATRGRAGHEGPPERVRLAPVFRPFRKDGQLHASMGDTVLTLRASEWPRLDALVEALRAAADELSAQAA